MTDQELEKAYMNMIENRKPDLWNRIEEEIDALEIRQAGAETETDRQNDMQAAIAAEQKNKSEIVAEQNIAQEASYTDSQGFEQATADEGRTKHAKHAKKEKKMNKPKLTFLSKIGNFCFGGSTLRAAASVCVLVIVASSVIQIGSGSINESSYKSDYLYSDSAYATSAATASMDGGSFGAAYEAAPAEASGGTMAADVPAEWEAADAGYKAEEGISNGTADAEMASAAAAGGTDVSTENADTNTDADQSNGRKLIRNISMDVETLTFDALISDLKAKVTSLGGYIEYSEISGNRYNGTGNRSASFTFRIPTAKTDSLLDHIGTQANVLTKNENVEDVTLTYVDLESHLKALEEEETQLLKLMDRADNVDDLIVIQNELSNIRYQKEYYKSSLKSYDNKIAYDTLSIYVQEVKEQTPTVELTIWEKIGNGFMDSVEDVIEGLQDFFIWFVTSIPYFVVIFIVVFVVIFLIRKIRRRKK